MLGKVKLALRISHNLLDSDINATIDTARAELIRSGVSEKYANSNHPLVESAIKTYCLFVYANDDKKTQGYFDSWQYQMDNIRKSAEPALEEGDSDV
jgi:uncharacterized phage protein (predicted DNA packaging)